MTYRALAAAVLVVTIASSGCRRGGEEQTRVDPDDPEAACKVVSAADLASVVNLPPEERDFEFGLWRDFPPIPSLAGVQFCLFGNDRSFRAYVGLSNFSAEANRFARTSFDKWRRQAEEQARQAAVQPPEAEEPAGVAEDQAGDAAEYRVEAVRGLGDTAVWAGTDAGGHLVVLDGARILAISLGDPPARQRARVLADKALRRL